MEGLPKRKSKLAVKITFYRCLGYFHLISTESSRGQEMQKLKHVESNCLYNKGPFVARPFYNDFDMEKSSTS